MAYRCTNPDCNVDTYGGNVKIRVVNGEVIETCLCSICGEQGNFIIPEGDYKKVTARGTRSEGMGRQAETERRQDKARKFYPGKNK